MESVMSLRLRKTCTSTRHLTFSVLVKRDYVELTREGKNPSKYLAESPQKQT
jgi:hypothetical protein